MNSDTTIAVVIPFYQREKGILARALRSVVAQDIPDSICLKVVIVDDSSPVSPVDDIASVTFDARHRIELISQPNGGPGTARNLALATLDPAEVPFVAFLDSDDEWKTEHLRKAIATLSASPDYDFYFCDHTRFNTDKSWFEESEIFQKWAKGDISPAPVPVPGLENIYQMPSRLAFSAFLAEYLSQTSTVVYRFAKFPDARFDTDLRSAGEDHMLWITLAAKAGVAVFSTERNVICGQGVNIYFSAFDWNLPQTIDRYGYLVVFLTKLKRNFEMGGPDKQMIETRLAKFSKVYAYLLARSLAKGRAPNRVVLSKIFKLDPARVIGLPVSLVLMLKDKRSGNWDW
ncbi:glycosyltransferase family A protein [Phyllobacterium leguminum]|uniref:Succinoglycan biosynthesis protein ExoW n=1 Tax=Phyllobacterium leguminum TaxID=314237 RepID=A0A318T413_9HYPH|nr:glycosyltransferase family A protein [Phyllobacterium leguminum]PYE88793.1 succinoglycan biosynthesis protein ExoW [Phyllobacterium leguminum]